MAGQTLTAAALAILMVLAVYASATVIPADKEFVRSLDGQWHFRLEQKDPAESDHVTIGGQPRAIVLPKQFEPFEELTYKEDGSWKTINVPGNWEMAGFSVATYNQPDNTIGLYRLELDIPDGWKDRLVKINFDGVQNGAEVYLNGQPVNVDEPSENRPNFHQGGNTAFQADLTPAVKFGQKNLLALRVYKNTKAADLDSGDFFFLGGIHRPVTLFSVPQSHVDDLKVETRLLPESSAELRVIIKKAGPDRVSASAQLEGATVSQSEIKEGPGEVVITQTLDKPRLWSAEHPTLYTLRVTLKDGSDRVVETITRRVGVREVSIKDGVFLINNVPVKFTGICRHELFANLGSALNEDAWRKDITLMKWANINAIRTSHYPYGSGFYDLCDELGMYVMDEMSAGWCNTADAALAPAFAQHAREMVRRDKNHPSVVVWAVGNENKEGENNRVAADEIRKLDATRPRLVSWRKGDQYGTELDDLHYTAPARIAQLNADTQRRQKYPMIFLENPNVWEERNGADYGDLDLWVHVIDRSWQEIWKDEHVPGSFLWEWADRAVADQYPRKLYDYFPKTGINLAKVKGLVDAFRNPRADLYHVKMAYAPIVVDLKPTSTSGDAVTFHFTNRYSFTDLSELKTTWRLLAGGKEIKSAAAAGLALKPRSAGDVTIVLPADAFAQADALQLDFDRAGEGGGNVVTYLVGLKPEPDTKPRIDTSTLGGINFPRLNLVPVTEGKAASGWRLTLRHPVALTKISVEKAAGGRESVPEEKVLCAMPLADVRAMDAELFESDAPGKIVGRVHAEFGGGRFSYRIEWTKPNGGGRKNDPTDIQELGWTFTLPKSADHFSWHRKAYWSWYPPTHVGRPTGTATPDSADVDVTKITRPDAFDFTSTKFDCDWATLADNSGRGIAVAFSPDARHHCRAGIGSDGTYQLIVNQACAPPRDISSNIVPDLYLTLAQGAKVQDSFTVGTCTGQH